VPVMGLIRRAHDERPLHATAMNLRIIWRNVRQMRRSRRSCRGHAMRSYSHTTSSRSCSALKIRIRLNFADFRGMDAQSF
jgi:hypothetical protein